jgi:hypothetical protein
VVCKVTETPVHAALPDPPLPGALPFRPLLERYVALVQELGTVRQRYTEGGKFQSAFLALIAVLKFLEQDAQVSAANLTQPLMALGNALAALESGGRPPLIFGHKRRRGRATNQPVHYARGAIALGVERLMRAGKSRSEAGLFISRELSKLRFRDERNNTIPAKMVLLWRDEIGGRAPLLQTATFNNLDRVMPSHPTQLGTEAQVRAWLALVVAQAFV